MIPLDNRNPFAAWGHEEVKYSTVDSETSVALVQAGFESNLIDDEMKNEVAENAEFVVKTTLNGMPEAFDSNNDATVYPNVATNAYGMDNELQPEREPGENLEYYGIQGADLEKYNDGEDSEFEYATEDELAQMRMMTSTTCWINETTNINATVWYKGNDETYSWIITTDEAEYEKYNMAKFTSPINDEQIDDKGSGWRLSSKNKLTSCFIIANIE